MSLTVKDLSIQIDQSPVVNSANFTADDGQFVSILGASGAGKSTLLKAISGLLNPTQGDIRINGSSVINQPAHKRDCTLVFQDMRLFPHLSVLENVAFSLKMAGVSKKERVKTATEMLARVQLDHKAQESVLSLSGGQRQRVALARALVSRPGVLLLDEPFSGLDTQLRIQMRALVSALHKQMNLTTVMVTHDAQEALAVSDSIVYLSEGRTTQQTSPQNFYLHPETLEAATSFGDCSVLEGVIEGASFSIQNLELSCETQSFKGQASCVTRWSEVTISPSSTSPLRISSSTFMGDSWKVSIRIDSENEICAFTQTEYPIDTPVSVSIAPSKLHIYPL